MWEKKKLPKDPYEMMSLIFIWEIYIYIDTWLLAQTFGRKFTILAALVEKKKRERGESGHPQPIWKVNFSFQLLARKQASCRSVSSKLYSSECVLTARQRPTPALTLEGHLVSV